MDLILFAPIQGLAVSLEGEEVGTSILPMKPIFSLIMLEMATKEVLNPAKVCSGFHFER